MTTRLIDDSLFDGGADGAPPRLVGARCSGCGTVVFPRQDSCPRCSQGPISPHLLPVNGRVWSWTLQAFPPKPPYRPPTGGHRPYHVGYVDLGEVLVEARLAVARAEIRIGLPVRLTTVPAYHDDDGTEVLTFAFRPDTEGER
ncbi:Zn-ribbon domain-containing OB-fold protein [Streptomyces europaeiscabiei]|uniref:OB-fold domain-containing protein n=1 Tax=Streptomyces europaeiscabiei TaxID=146819 RepID=A0ABU4NHQ1_9ACTN|nr:OB-fold domain-containing protein [Streptomyces europaeiscabiei]MDX2759884.1 OB-fold domain-containing protein [Streptomyces europaeiscabiei]MDX3545531.1 OB-fold domain-containing protein [Streptomyces europaeiscabiei]MDX3555072.1 OB-fold domain-containing protein [Streptomyces europaeiscabiei]MDX3702663.1 OB-fold domain-containing protein [Streptomyces europaeiscabiei]